MTHEDVTAALNEAQLLDLATSDHPLDHDRQEDDPGAMLAHRAWHGFRAIDVGDPDGGDPFDTGGVDTISNVLLAMALDPECPRTLSQILDAALLHATEECRNAGVEIKDPPVPAELTGN